MEILGLLDALESMILDGTKIPLTRKVLIKEDELLALIDKMRLVIQGGGGFAKDAIASKKEARSVSPMPQSQNNVEETIIVEELEGRSREEGKAVEVLQQAYQMAKEIRGGADKYADEILANLEATSTRILRTIQAGRDRLNKTTKKVETEIEEKV